MKYEVQFEKAKCRVLDPNTKKLITEYTARYEVDFFDGLKLAATAALADKYLGFAVADTKAAQRISIEYADQPDIETAAVNLVLDGVLEAWLQETGATTWA